MISSRIKKLNNRVSSDVASSTEEGLKALRNGYIALTFTLCMTFIGYLLGNSYLSMMADVFNGGIGILLFFVIFIPIIFAIEALKYSVLGLGLLLLFGLLQGLFLVPIINVSETNIVFSSLIGTVLLFIGVASFAKNSSIDASKWGAYLSMTLLALIVVMLLNFFVFESSVLQIAISSAVIIIMSLFIFYDVQRALKEPKASYISIALSFYLSFINIFINLLVMLGMLDD